MEQDSVQALDRWFGLNDGGHKAVTKAIVAVPYQSVYGSQSQHLAQLHMFVLPNGKRLMEEVQANPWSPEGPCWFTALRNQIGNWVRPSLWDEDEIAKCLRG